jgi:flagellar biogenesis protein FliO
MPGNGAAASYGDLLITSLVVLAGVCIAAFIVVKVVGRFLATGRMRGVHLLDIVARLPLEPRRSLYVVEVAGKTLLVGTSEMGLSVLSELDGAEVKARAVPKQSFGDLVRSAWLRRRGTSDDSAETASAHAGASVATVKDGSSVTSASSVASDVSTETPSAHVGANSAIAKDGSSVSSAASSHARSAHVGAKSEPAAASNVSAETPSAHVGANSSIAKDETNASNAVSSSRGDASSDDSAETRSAHVGVKSEREGA